MIALIFMLPTLQLLILPLAATFEMKEIKMHVIDFDNSTTSRELIGKFSNSPFYRIIGTSYSHKQAEKDIITNKADMILEIPANMERDLHTLGTAKVQFAVNAINSTVAELSNAYSSSIVNDYNTDIATELTGATYSDMLHTPTYAYWFNPQLDYKTYMVPGILILLVAIIGLFLTTMNMVREKEIGTMEQINVTPIRKWEFIIGKSIPFILIGMLELTLGLILASTVYNIPILGNVGLIYLTAFIFLFSVLGIGLFLSAISNTQQQAMFIAWFFVMIFILLSGLLTPAESMPAWAQYFDYFNPMYYGVKITRMVILKGSGFADISNEFFALVIYGAIAMGLAIAAYRKTS
jgi:ABC-2 type transport system permease protein